MGIESRSNALSIFARKGGRHNFGISYPKFWKLAIY
jgi:hypothetical protein